MPDRRRELAEATLRVIASNGYPGLSVRRIAREAGFTTGVIAHHFDDKDELLLHAMRLFFDDLLEPLVRARESSPLSLSSLRAALLIALPLTPEQTDRVRVWVSFVGQALVDPRCNELHRRCYRELRAILTDIVKSLRAAGVQVNGGSSDNVSRLIIAFIDGLSVDAILEPANFPPKRQLSLLDNFLASIFS